MTSSIFVDASALIAIVAKEEDGARLASALDGENRRLYSAVSLWETQVGLSRSYHLKLNEAEERVDRFLSEGQFQLVPIGETELHLALEAHQRFGKGKHGAALNMGDCFAYACAKANKAKLLYKGEDFVQTDLA